MSIIGAGCRYSVSVADTPTTSSGQFTVLVSEHLSSPAAQWLERRCRVLPVAHNDTNFDEALGEADGLLVRTYTRVDEALLNRAPKLRVVGRAGVGLDNIDIAACRARGIEVVYTPDANTQAVVEYVMSLLCDALRPRVSLDHAVDARQWNDLRAQTVGRREIASLTLGILGLGRVGRRLARAATGLGMKVLYNDLRDFPPNERNGASPVSPQALFEHADVLSVHIDGRASNRNFISERFFNRMNPQAIFINTSRGFVVDTPALASFLRANTQASALLDVHEPEPFDEQYPLLGLANATLYPHLASRTEQAMENMSWVVRDVLAVLQGEPPQHPAPAATPS